MMAYSGFKKGGFKKEGGFKKSFGGPRASPRPFNRSGGGMELFDATCANCGNSCQVPFKPTGQKPVLCRDCFKKNDDAPRFSRAPRAESSDELAEINEKLDRIMAALKID
jgi:CxxC-x17-CxxC domain-containing protein